MKILLIMLAATVGLLIYGQEAGTMTLKFTTVKLDKAKDKAKYSPRNVVVAWVVSRKGEFVRTIRLAGKKRYKYLKVWASNSNKNRIDAVTSATLKKHDSMTVTWDCKDAKGKLVPDGEYEIRVEYTSMHLPGPVTPEGFLRFNKGSKAVTLKPQDLPNFKDVELTYKPGSQGLVKE